MVEETKLEKHDCHGMAWRTCSRRTTSVVVVGPFRGPSRWHGVTMNLTEFFLSCKWCLHPQLCRMGYTFAFGLVGVIVISYALLSTASEGTLDIVHAHAVLMATAFVWVLPVLLMLQYFPK